MFFCKFTVNINKLPPMTNQICNDQSKVFMYPVGRKFIWARSKHTVIVYIECRQTNQRKDCKTARQTDRHNIIYNKNYNI